MDAKEYIGQAQREKNPHARARILRNAAVEYAKRTRGAASPKDKERLTAIGLQFAHAAMRVFEPTAPGMNHDSSTDDRALHALHALYPEGIEEAARQGTGPSIKTPMRVSIAPATFTEETAIGRIATVKYAPTSEEMARGITQESTVAFWQGDKVESQEMSVDVGFVIPVPPNVPPQIVVEPFDARPYAKITYGADGNTQNQVKVDVGAGRRISVMGNYVSVAVGMDPTFIDALGAHVASAELSIGASIARGSALTHAPVVRSVYIDALVAGAQTGLIQIPARAVRLLPPLGNETFDDTITVFFASIDGARSVGTWKCVFSSASPFASSYPIPADAYYFSVKSVKGAGIGGYIRVPFELSL